MSATTNWATVLTKEFLEGELGAGRTAVEIARQVGCAPNTLRSYLGAHHLSEHDTYHPDAESLAEAYRQHGSIRAVATSLQVPFSTARDWLIAAGVSLKSPRPPTPRAEFDVDVAARRYQAGEGYEAIAADLGVTAMTLRKRLIEGNHIVPRHRGRPRSEDPRGPNSKA